MKLTLGFSPCPNDTFIFDALVNNKIEAEGFEFETVLEDVQTLNEGAIRGLLDVTKISYGVWPLVLNEYALLSAGGAMGKGVGPLLIARPGFSTSQIKNAVVAIPGKNTTANILFSMAFPGVLNKSFMVFSDIENAVLSGTADAGVIIHENRFTFEEKGLVKIIDLGHHWEQKTSSPIPLGGIAIRKRYDHLKPQIDKLIRGSISCAYKQYPLLSDYVKQHAQAMDEQVMRRHIDLYVNDYSVDYGEEGILAINHLMQVYREMNNEAKYSA